MLISIILSFRNEVDSIRELSGRVHRALAPLGMNLPGWSAIMATIKAGA